MKNNKVLLLTMSALMLVGCGGNDQPKGPTVSISYSGNSDQVQFAISDIRSSVEENGMNNVDTKGDYQIVLGDIDSTLGEQEYSIDVNEKIITVKGGDETGLMYGGLEVAEQLQINKTLDKIESKVEKPYLKERGFKCNHSLDMRTPTYDEPSTSVQDNIESTWDINFWKKQFDFMARNRYNAYSMWNLDPLPSMVKIQGYEDCALNDIYKTNVKLDYTYFTGSGSKNFMPEFLNEGNYQVVKQMTIDEKISFWKEVMAYAHSRGVKFYIYQWNIYNLIEPVVSNYGIDNDPLNPVTVDYMKKGVKAMVDTYPDLDGYGFAAGENIPSSLTVDVAENFLHSVYGEGIIEALADEPDRKFDTLHRMHFTNADAVNKYWSDYPYPIDFSDKYSFAHMYSAENPQYADENTEEISKMNGSHDLILEVRNDDAHVHSWGGYDFAQKYLAGIKSKESRNCIRGFFMGADGHLYGNDFSMKDADLNGKMLYMEKHYLNFLLFGRLAYNTSIPSEFFRKKLQYFFKDIDPVEVSKLYDAMNLAAPILTTIGCQYNQSMDLQWYPEYCRSYDTVFGFLDIRRFIDSPNSHPHANVMSLRDYALALEKSQTTFDCKTPKDTCETLDKAASDTISKVDEMIPNLKEGTAQEKLFKNVVLDQKAFALLGKYYSNKFNGAIQLRLFNDLQEEQYKTAAVNYLKAGVENWKEYASLFDSRYNTYYNGRAGVADPTALITNVEKDVSIAEKWTKKNY